MPRPPFRKKKLKVLRMHRELALMKGLDLRNANLLKKMKKYIHEDTVQANEDADVLIVKCVSNFILSHDGQLR